MTIIATAVIQGFVYFVTDGEAVKIGFARKPSVRLQELQVSHHRELHMIGTISGTDHQEKMLHNRFRHLRIRGEWFRLDPEILDFIKEFSDDGLVIGLAEHKLNNYILKFETRQELDDAQ